MANAPKFYRVTVNVSEEGRVDVWSYCVRATSEDRAREFVQLNRARLPGNSTSHPIEGFPGGFSVAGYVSSVDELFKR